MAASGWGGPAGVESGASYRLVVFAAAGEPLPPDRKRDGAVEMRYEVLDEEGGGGGDEVSSGRLIAGDA